MADQGLEQLKDIQIMPVIRATSFDKKTKKAMPLFMKITPQKQIFTMH